MEKKLLIFLAGVLFLALSVASNASSSKWTLKLTSEQVQTELSLEEITNLPFEETIRRGSIYKGVLLRVLLAHKGIDIGEIEYVEITASDGYRVKYNRKLAKSFNVILAYEKNGSLLSEEKEGKIRAIVTGGRSAMQIKFVERILVKTGSWRLTLISDEQEKEYNLSELQEMPSERVSSDSRVYRGVSLMTFLKRAGIDIEAIKAVEVIAADNYAVNYKQEMILQGKIILAYEMDGAPLPEKMGRLRCVFPGKDKKMQVKKVERIIVK